jgi:hypothetical protein
MISLPTVLVIICVFENTTYTLNDQAGGPLEVLRANGFTEFADLVESEASNMLAGITGTRRHTLVIWAPVNCSPRPSLPPDNTTLSRRTPYGEDVAALQMTMDDGAKL